MSTRFSVACSCGFAATCKSRALADYSLRRHSCEKTRRLAATAERVAARKAASGPEAPCRHGDQHPHGHRNRYVIDKCRCRPCRDAAAVYERQRQKERAYGNEAYVDAAPARAHLNALRQQGMGWKRVARAAGLEPSVVWKLLYGDRARGMAPSKRLRAATRDAILAVELDLAPAALVDATGTRRRLQALATLGWGVKPLACRAGVDQQRLYHSMHEALVQHETAGIVRRLYDELWQTPSPSRRANAIRAEAARQGWAPPLAWDDEEIDDPAARHAGALAGRRPA